MRAFVALTVIVLSTSVSAQTLQGTTTGPDTGFFRPTPNNDPSLTNPPVVAPRTPEPFLGRAPATVQVPVQTPMPATTVVAEEAVQKAEAETARAQREAEEAARKSASTLAPVTGNFTGLTSERNR
jgi:hypothetical protein